MNFLKLDHNHIKQLVNNLTKVDIESFLRYSKEFLTSENFSYLSEFYNFSMNLSQIKKHSLVDLLVKLLQDVKFKQYFCEKLISTHDSASIYHLLIWEYHEIEGISYNNKYNLNLKTDFQQPYFSEEYKLTGSLSFINHYIYYSYGTLYDDILFIKREIREVLKLLFPLPRNFFIHTVDKVEPTKYSYTNEDGIFTFITIIKDMLKSNLVEFGKTNEKPLAKTLNILKSSAGVKEFYEQKKLNSLVTDMLTRSFSYFYWSKGVYDKQELSVLKYFITSQLKDDIPFFITRIFTSHLKRVRYDDYSTSQKQLFEIVSKIIKLIPKDGYLSVENVLDYLRYRSEEFHLESKYKTTEYYCVCDVSTLDGIKTTNMYVKENFRDLYFNPILKASLFFLGALGVLELKYNNPKNELGFTTTKLDYLTPWDGLKYIKFTALGRYIFGYEKTYKPNKIDSVKTEIKFDEYKPIITVDSKDSITIAKLDPYCDKIDTNRYILSYSKIFKDCPTIKALKLKIDSFRNITDKPLPNIFEKFFQDILNKTNMVKKIPNLVTLQLSKNQELLNLFLHNKKLQELTIKASGYKIVVEKDNITKVTKIIKDNGFFIEF